MQIPSLQGLGSIASLLSSKQKATPSTDQTQQVSAPKSTSKTDELSSLLSSFGLGELDSQASIVKAFAFSTQQADFSFNSGNVYGQGSAQSLNLQATIQQGNQLLNLNLQVTQATIGLVIGNQGNGSDGGSQGTSNNGNDLLANLIDRLPPDAREQVQKYQQGQFPADFFSSSNVANRISDFALNGFSFFDGGKASAQNTQDSRQRFADFILPAIDKGIQQAKDILGDLPDQILAGIQETRDKIGQRFKDFVQGTNSSKPTTSTIDTTA